MRLNALQRTMAQAVMQPLTASEHMQQRAPDGRPMRAYAARFIKPNDRLTSFERLEIYNRQYWFRLLSSMIEDFPGVCAVLGDRRFEAACKAYLLAHPSRSFTLRNLASHFESWLRKHPQWAGARQALAVDMARLEWAEIEAFDGKAEPALGAKELAGTADPNLRLKLQPYIRLLSLRYPLDDLLLEVKDANDDSEVASNAFQERRKRKHVQAMARLKPSPIFLAVHRVDGSVYFRRLESEEFAIMSALQQGKTIRRAVDLGFRKSAVAPTERPAAVQEWFKNWAALGWFYRPAKKNTDH
jgi:hypothetical protein